MSTELLAMVPELLRIAQEAGAIAMGGFRRTGISVSKKGVIDLVTEFDLASEAYIVQQLSRSFPGVAIVGEEGHDSTTRGSGELTFYVDPIDGTTNFAHGHPFFGVSLGLCRDGAPLAGVIVAPALGTHWTGVVGQGAFRNGVPCTVSKTQLATDALCATGFGYQVVGAEDDNLREFALVQSRVQAVRRCGAAALDLALVADGTYDGYWEFMLQPWDMSAGAALVLAAAGRVTSFDLTAVDVRQGACIASNGPIHPALAELIREARAGRPVPVR